jgi:hypothetical protein
MAVLLADVASDDLAELGGDERGGISKTVWFEEEMKVSRSRDEHRESGKRTTLVEEKTHGEKRCNYNHDLHPHLSRKLLFKVAQFPHIEGTMEVCNERLKLPFRTHVW